MSDETRRDYYQRYSTKPKSEAEKPKPPEPTDTIADRIFPHLRENRTKLEKEGKRRT